MKTLLTLLFILVVGAASSQDMSQRIKSLKEDSLLFNPGIQVELNGDTLRTYYTEFYYSKQRGWKTRKVYINKDCVLTKEEKEYHKKSAKELSEIIELGQKAFLQVYVVTSQFVRGMRQ